MEQYPKWLYHAIHEPQVVETPQQHDELGAEWAETPSDALKAHIQAQQPKPTRKKG